MVTPGTRINHSANFPIGAGPSVAEVDRPRSESGARRDARAAAGAPRPRRMMRLLANPLNMLSSTHPKIRRAEHQLPASQVRLPCDFVLP
jgi:hypothetical protein